MDYPVWYLPGIGGGTLIALIAVTHVFVSQFAVGGGLYLVLVERKAIRESDPALLEFARKFTKFFLLLTLVYGSITGVGIWFVISLVNPAATSLLIHNFVFGWASEWVLFLVEIVSITLYFYTFDKMDHRLHQTVGWIYFLSGWFSLFIINGIITFMLTPGAWRESHDFWAGFFNPTFWPATAFRTLMALLLAGVFALAVVPFLRDADLKAKLGRFSGTWVLLALVGGVPSGYWYLMSLPEEARQLFDGRMPAISVALRYGAYAAIGLVVLTVFFGMVRPVWHNKTAGLLVLACAFMVTGTFEWVRENARRPYVVDGSPGVLYSVSMSPQDLATVQEQGFLPSARWSRFQKVTEANFLAAGEELFKFQCYACHTVGGLNNDIIQRTRGMSFSALEGYIEQIHQIRYFMPPFAGTDTEAKALAAWIVKDLHGGEIPPVPRLLAEEATGEEPTPPGVPPGQSVFEEHCSICHQLGEGPNPIQNKVAGWSRKRIREALDQLPQLNPAMPPLKASAVEKEALADFLARLAEGGAQ